MCNLAVPGDINAHVESCLKRSERITAANSDEDDEGSIDVEGEAYEEYEWAGQTRIRASSLLQGGYSGAGKHLSIIEKIQIITHCNSHNIRFWPQVS